MLASEMSQPAPEFATLTADDLVTGEAVALDLPPAGLGTRAASGLIDVAVTLVSVLVVALLLLVATVDSSAALMKAAWVLVTVICFLVVPTTIETLTRGRTLGKLALGLRTVRDDGGPISFHHAFVRSLVGFVEVYAFTGAPAFISALVSARGKRLGDHAAGTYVVSERVRLTLPPPVPMPPPLASWAASADVAALPVGLALAIRQFLARTHEITPQSRATIGAQLAARTAPLVSPAPPPGTPPEAFLAAVIAVRRERDAARLAREAELRDRWVRRQTRVES
jgi:uncharacterized RDD family membrane protein YckC